MNPITKEWVRKAEGDWATATREARARKRPNPDAVCFHAQQCVEKYLKARLHHAGIACPRTHDLEAVLAMLLPVEPLWAPWRIPLASLSYFAVVTRYPGDEATKTQAKDAVKLCRQVRAAVRASLGLRA